MGFPGEDRPGIRFAGPAWLAFIWGILFGVPNLAWALGSRLGVDHLAVAIQDDIARGDSTLNALNVVGGLGKIALAFLALSTIKTWGRALAPGLVTALLYLFGGGLTLYGLLNWGQMLLAKLGVIDVPKSIGEAQVNWYLALWEPLWIIGGLALIGTARAFQLRSRN